MNASTYREELSQELKSILEYWMSYTPDEREGGFLGRIDENDRPDYQAPKGLVLNARILWAFSAAWRFTGQWIYRPVATRAYDYLTTHFLDKDFGGAFWSLTPTGQPLNIRKQIYGQAFTLYGLTEYYRATGDQTVLDQAIELYHTLEKHGYDPTHKGYFEGFANDWSTLEDLRLSARDANEKKTTNTQLHILEAYTNLYYAWPDAALRRHIIELLEIFKNYIVDPSTGHLHLFFTEDWQPRSHLISYGHDIEAAWLLHQAAVSIEDSQWQQVTKDLALKLATAATEGLDTDGGLWYENEGQPEKHWWPQAEAMIGFLKIWRLTDDPTWWQRSTGVWNFVKQYIRDPKGMEWYWGVQRSQIHKSPYTPMPGHDKAGFWKCPYHNSRACLEIVRLLSPKFP